MEAIKLELYQSEVNYRREGNWGYVQTYPLPTPSMIRGMVHAVLEVNEYLPLQVSIQGTYESVYSNIQRVYKFDRRDRDNAIKIIDVGDLKKSVVTSISCVDLIIDSKLIIHILFEDSSLHQKLLNKIRETTLSLGRWEDVARVDILKIVQLKKERDDITLKNHMYIPKNLWDKKYGALTTYRLPFKYDIIGTKRRFNYIDTVLVPKDYILNGVSHYIDDDGDLAVPLSANL